MEAWQLLGAEFAPVTAAEFEARPTRAVLEAEAAAVDRMRGKWARGERIGSAALRELLEARERLEAARGRR